MHSELKKIVEGFFKSADSVDPLDYKDQDEVKREIKRLDIVDWGAPKLSQTSESSNRRV